MPKVRLDSKFTYSNTQGTIKIPGHPNDRPDNWNIYAPSDFDVSANNPIVCPVTALPALGNNHNQRHGNRITVSSVRWQSLIRLNEAFLYPSYNPLSDSATSHSTPDPPQRFFKLRYMLVQFDNDYADEINERFLHKWFMRTYCRFTTIAGSEPTTIEEYEKMPVSVHSNVLHETTPYTSKFNVLCDKCLTLYSSKPQIALDITIPLNKTYLFEEGTNDGLIYPCLWMFILPPLNLLSDVDPITKNQIYLWQTGSGALSYPLFDIDNFTKLNFIDL